MTHCLTIMQMSNSDWLHWSSQSTYHWTAKIMSWSVFSELAKEMRKKNEAGLRRGTARELIRLSLMTPFWNSRSWYTLWLVDFDSTVNTLSVLSVTVNQMASAVWLASSKSRLLERCFHDSPNQFWKNLIFYSFCDWLTLRWNQKCEQSQTLTNNGIYSTQNNQKPFM